MIELKQSLAAAKQLFEELTRITSIDALANGKYGDGAKRQRISYLVCQLYFMTDEIKAKFSKYIDAMDSTPIMELSPGLKEFYISKLEPFADKLSDIFWNITGLSNIKALVMEKSPLNINTPIADAINWGLERWLNMLDEDELEDWRGRGFNIEDAVELIDKRFFKPDSWRENLELLRPVLVSCTPDVVPPPVQYRLREIYRAFTFDLWMSAIALSRSVAEYAIINNAKRLKFDPTFITKNGKKLYKSFELLISDVIVVRPDMKIPLDDIRKTANRILHPKKIYGEDNLPNIKRDEALECISKTRHVVECLYSA